MRRYGSYFVGMNSGEGGGSGSGDVISVNGKSGMVIITSTDINFNNAGTNLSSKNLQAVVKELNTIMEKNKTDITDSNDDIVNLQLRMSECCGKVMLHAGDTLGYLEDKIDKATIQSIGGKLVAKSLDGLIASVNELNQTKGATSNIQAQIDGLSSMGNFTQSVPTETDLTTIVNPKMNDIVIVLEDSLHGGASSTYMYNGTTFVYVGEFKVRMRDFTTDPINLATEVVGKLPVGNISDDIITTNDIDKTVIGKITEGVDGNMQYDGKPIISGGSSEHELIANEF